MQTSSPRALELGKRVLALALLAACDPAVVEPAPSATVESPASNDAREAEREAEAAEREAEAAADRIRDAIHGLDPERCLAESQTVLRSPPASGRLRAWASACLAEAGHHITALEHAAAMEHERPGDPRSAHARLAAALAEHPVADPEVLPASEALRVALADHPDALLLRARALNNSERLDELLTLVDAHPEVPLLAAARARALLRRAADAPETMPEALAAVAAARGPAAIDAAFVAAWWLHSDKRHVEALVHIDAALAQAPDSTLLHSQRWQILRDHPGLTADQRRDAIVPATLALLERRPDSPAALRAAVDIFRELELRERSEPLEARLLRDFADSPAAEALLHQRLVDGHAESLGPTFTAEQRARRRDELAAYLARPRHHDRLKREGVANMLFSSLSNDPSSPPDALLAAVEGVVATRHLDPGSPSEAALALAARGIHLERAEAILRDSLEALTARLDAQRRGGTPEAILVMVHDDILAVTHEARGAIALAANRLEDAERELLAARALAPNFPRILNRLAELARRRGDRDGAELLLVECLDRPFIGGENPCKPAFAALYREQHRSLRGLERRLERLRAGMRESRRAAILAEAIADPALLPPFDLERLDGGRFTSEALHGKISVINFWFTNCQPCAEEMPELQRLVDAYAGDPEVRITTVHHGGATSSEIAAWMRERGYHFDVLLDDGYCKRSGMLSYPTTWFVDRDGRIVYTVSATTHHLREEFGWRIEALKRRPWRAAPLEPQG